MSSNTLAGLPFAFVCLGIVVYAVVLIVGTLALPREPRESDEEGRADLRVVLVAALILLALLARYDRSPAECSRATGAAWSVEDGATEQLDAFGRCTR